MVAFKFRLLAGSLVALMLGAGLFAGSTSAVQPQKPSKTKPKQTQTPPRPFKVTISNLAGTPRIKVARTLRVKVTCNRDCVTRVKGSLRMVVGHAQWKAAPLNQPATRGRLLSYRLSNLGLRSLRRYTGTSWYVIEVVARDPKTGEKIEQTRSFRFSR